MPKRSKPEIIEDKIKRLEAEIEKCKQQLKDYWKKKGIRC